MAENQSVSFTDSIRDARQRLELELHAQADQIQKLSLEMTELQHLHERIEREASRQWDEVTHAAELSAAAQPSPEAGLENVLGAVRSLMTCTIPDHVFATLTEEAAEWGVRAAIFDVRGKAAWGASAHGFGPALTDKVLRSLIVQLNQESPFRQVCETAGHVEASAESLKKNRNILDKLKPAPQAPILLLPIRSAGTVAAIFYADPGEKTEPLPASALKILAEFAGAQIDRLIALSGGFPDAEARHEQVVETAESESPVEDLPVEAAIEESRPAEGEAPVKEIPVEAAAEAPQPAEVRTDQYAEGQAVMEAPVVEAPIDVAVPSAPVAAPLEPPTEQPGQPLDAGTRVVESEAAATHAEPNEDFAPPPSLSEAPPTEAQGLTEQPASPAATPSPAFDVTQLSDADQKIHKDAKRFAKLLVSEIELYNKAKVADGRKNHDLYKRLKSDIDRSRQTFDKRFGKALSKQIDYFHDEMVKTLAINDSAVLGPEYPGPSA